MDIKTWYPVKRPRRSSRLYVKEQQQRDKLLKEDILATYALGYFDLMPLELRFKILSFLTVEELSIMTICSKAMRNLVDVYKVTQFSGKHSLFHLKVQNQLSVEDQANSLDKYHKFGLLIKRSTCLYATKDRLKIINGFLTRMTCTNADSSQNVACFALLCFGKLLHTVIAGWDDSECQRAFDAICQHVCMQKHIKLVMSSKPGSRSDLEISVRHFFRGVFLDLCPTVCDKAFWLTRILKPWPIVFQARLLYIIYSGNLSGKVQWQEMSESTPVDIAHSMQFYGNLAMAFQLLNQHSQEWSSDEIICIIDEMTSMPDDWLIENVAGLLFSCGESIALKMLVSKVINGRYAEISSIIASLCLVCVKYSQDLKQVMGMLEHILRVIDSGKDRLLFLTRISNTFRELIIDSHEYTESGDANETEFFYFVAALTEFNKEMSLLAFKNLTSSDKVLA